MSHAARWHLLLSALLLSATEAPVQGPAVDQSGDPLPVGAVARFGTLRYRPALTNYFWNVSDTSPDRQLIATGERGFVRFWERNTGKEIGHVKVPGATTLAVVFSPDRKRLIAHVDSQGLIFGGDYQDLCLVDVERCKVISTWNERQAQFASTQAVFIQGGTRYLFVHCKDKGPLSIANVLGGDEERDPGVLYVCDSGTGNVIFLLNELGAHCLSPDQKTLMAAIGTKIGVFDLADGKEMRSWETGPIPTQRLKLSADGATILSLGVRNSIQDAAGEDGQKARIQRRWTVWDVRTGKELGRRDDDVDNLSCSLSPDGCIVSTLAGKNSIFWDVGAAKRISWIPDKDQRRTAILANGLCLFAEEKDGVIQRIRAERGAKEVWSWLLDTQGAAPRRSWGDLSVIDERTGIDLADRNSPRNLISTLEFSRDGLYAFTLDGWSLRVWETTTGRALPTPRLEKNPIRYSFLDGGKKIAAVCLDGTVHVWKTADGKPLRRFPIGDLPMLWNWYEATSRGQWREEINCQFTSSGERLVLAINRAIEVWDVANGQRLVHRKVSESPINRLLLAPGDRYIHTGNKEREYRLETIEGELVRQWGDKELNYSAKLSANGKHLAHGTLSGWVIVNLETGQEMDKLRGLDGHFSSDDTLMAATHREENSIQLWDVASGRQMRSIKLREEQHWRHSVLEFFNAPDGRIFAVLSLDPKHSQREILDVAGNRRIHQLEYQEYRGEFSPDGRVYLTMRDKPALKEVATGTEIGTFPAGAHRASLTLAAFTPDGRRVATAGREASVVVWDWPRALGLLPESPPSEGELAKCWLRLTERDARAGNRALFAFAATPATAVPFLRDRLKPATREEGERMRRLIAALDDDNFTVRGRARKQLLLEGTEALPYLNAAMDKAPSAEAEASLAKLLDAPELYELSPEHLRELRAIQALEWMDGPEARRSLQALADGEPGASRTREAKAALARMSR